MTRNGEVKVLFLSISHFHNHAQSLKVKHSGGPLDNQTWQTNGWPQQKLPKFGFRTHTTALWPVEKSSILSAKIDCPVARQSLLLLATAHDCETGLQRFPVMIVTQNTIHAANQQRWKNVSVS